MQNWQFYLHMLALCVIILLLYLFFREYKRHKAQAKSDAIAPTAPPRPVQVPLSHAHLQTMQSLVAGHKVAPSATRFETESNLDRELSAELNDLGRIHGAVDAAVDDVAHSDTSSESNRSATSASKDPMVAGSPVRQVIEFVPKKAKRRANNKAEA